VARNQEEPKKPNISEHDRQLYRELLTIAHNPDIAREDDGMRFTRAVKKEGRER
jgi:hypothetical protein